MFQVKLHRDLSVEAPNVKALAHLLAEAGVDHEVVVVITENH